MAKSSINFQKANLHNFNHNDRSEEKTAKTIYSQYSHLNQFDIRANRGKNLFNNLYKNTIKKVTGRTRKANKKNTLWEALVNIKTNTTMEDLKSLQVHIENKFKFTGLQIAIHKDEGHYDEDGKFVTNNHAHMLFFTLDKQTGRQMYRREFLNKKTLRELQDDTAKILNMDRGEYVEVSKRKRLEHKEYKTHIQSLEKERAKQKDLKEEIKKLREDLKSVKAERKDYAKLEQLSKDLKLQIQEKNLSIDELKKELDLFKNEFISRDELIDDLEIENVNLKSENEFLKAKNKKLESSLKTVLGENEVYENKIKNLENELRIVKAKSSMFLNLNNELNEKIKSLKILLENFKKEEKKDLDFTPELIPDISHLENRNSFKKHLDKDNI